MLAGLSKRKVAARNYAPGGAQVDCKKRPATARNRLAKNFLDELNSRGKNVESRGDFASRKNRARRKCNRCQENGAHEIFILAIEHAMRLVFRGVRANFAIEYSE